MPLAWTSSHAASPANIPNLKSGAVVPDVPDFTAGDPIGTTHDWNLGPTGARGWMWGWLLSTDLARQIYVTSVAAGSPAAQSNKLQVGDVILGINGGLFTSDARIALGKAITEAEKSANNGQLNLTRWRAGTTSTVTITLPVKGSYSTLSPVSCSKSTAVMQSACQYIVNKGLTADIQGYVNALGLLATGDSQYATVLQTYARSLNPRTAPGNWNWDAAYMNLFLCEYYLATGDTQVLPEINQLCLFLANGQSQVGSWGHSPALPNQILGGYGALNSVGLVCAISLELGRKCGVNEPAVDLAVTRAADFFRRYVGCGAVPYGDHAPPQLHDDNGKSSMAAVFYDLIGEAVPTAYFSRMTVASYGLREMGHTGNYWSYIWGPLGAQRSGDEATAAFLKEQYWFYDLERRWDGGFVYQGGADQSGSEHKTPGWEMTGARVLMYAMPLKKLYITGKSPSSAPALTTAEVSETILSGSDFSYWYAMNQLTREAYDDLTTAQLLARLDTWSCEQRERAARALARKASPPIADYRTMIQSTDRDTILGGLCGLNFMGAAALPALADVQPLLNHSDIWIQFQAGKVMCAIGASARNTTLPVVLDIASDAPDANDPRQFRQRFAAYNLWGNGWLEQSGFGLMRNFNGADKASLIPAVRKTMQHEHSVPRMYLAEWLDTLSFDELAPYWFDIYKAVETQAPTAVMWNHESRNRCLDILRRNNFKETVDAAATYAETMKNHGAEYRMGEVMDVLVSFGTEAQRVLPRLRAARTEYLANWGPSKPYDFPQWAVDDMIAALDAGIAAIEAATTAPANLKTIYDYSMTVLVPAAASPATVDVDQPTTLSITVSQGEDLPITYTWSKVSGPGVITFGSANAATTTATFSVAGLYEVQVTMQDAYRTKTDVVQVLVGGQLAGELGRLNLAANGGINPATGALWQLGDTYRLVFVSSGTTAATSTNLATYDTFVQGLATTAGLGNGWKVIGSSSTTDARDHTATNPNTNGSAEAVILIDGSTVIANNYADLWDGSIDAAINVTEQGSGGINASVFTGTYVDGTNNDPDGRVFGGSSEPTPKVTTGKSSQTNSWWIRDFNFAATSTQRVYAISKVLQIVASYPPSVDAGADQETYLIEGTGSAAPVANAHFEWDAAKDVAGNSEWTSSTGNAYTWTFDGGNLSPVAVTDARFDKLTHAYAFPAAKDADNGSWDGLGSDQSATFEFVIDVDNDNGLLFESGGTTVGIQFDISGGNLRGYIKSTNTYTVSYPLSTTDKSRFIHAVFVVTLNGSFKLYVDGVMKSSVAFPQTDWSGSGSAGLGNSTNTSPNANNVDFQGKMALFRYYKNKALSATEVVTNFNALSSAASGTINLNGTVVDFDDANPTTTWTKISGPAAVSFGSASSATTTATFTQPGTYTLRLTANDGNSSPVSDDLIVIVHEALPATYWTWAYGTFNGSFGDKAVGSNPDGDHRSNLMEFAFGTDPTITDMGPLAINGSRRGDPLVKAKSGGGFELYYIRRKDHGTLGSVTYTVRFSTDLVNFSDNDDVNNPPARVIELDSNYELMKVTFPSPARFGCVRVAVTP